MDGSDPVSLDEFLNFSLENKSKPIFQAEMVLQQYRNFMCIFSYDANDNRQVLRKKDKGWL